MTVRDRMFELQTPQEVEQFLERYPTGAIFKAGSCHKTMQGFGVVEETLSGYPNLHLGFIRVVESRPASNYVEELTGVVHESPQFLLFVDGKCRFDLDNWDIVPELMDQGLRDHCGAPQVVGEASGPSDLSSYVDLLEKYIGGVMDEAQFEMEWKVHYKGDASPRSKEEVEMIQSLYPKGMVHIGSIRERAEKLLRSMKRG